MYRLGMARAVEIIDDHHAALFRHVPGARGLCDMHSGDTCHLCAVLMDVANKIDSEMQEHLVEHS